MVVSIEHAFGWLVIGWMVRTKPLGESSIDGVLPLADVF